MGILLFLWANRRFLAFGVLLAFFSSFGQTYFIALFGAEVRGAFALSHGDFGAIYAAATLASAAALIWAGRKIDDLDLRLYTALICAGLIVACASMALVPAAWALFGAIFLLRFTGQGLLSHTAITSMARYFAENRGKAISVASMGFPAGEAVLPIVAVSMIAAFGWRETWGAVAATLAVILLPLMLWLLKGHGERHRTWDEATRSARESDDARRHWSRGEVLRDPRFYVLLPSVLATSFIVTGVFFHQVHIVEAKGWTMTWFAACFAAYAAAQTAASLATGILVDRFGGYRLLRYYLLPLVAALVGLGLATHALVALWFMVLAGLGSGAVAVVHGAVWAEIYGLKHIGAIRALSTSLMVFSTALSPAILGWLIDAGIGVEALMLGCAAYAGLAALLVRFGLPALERRIA